MNRLWEVLTFVKIIVKLRILVCKSFYSGRFYSSAEEKRLQILTCDYP